jgi:RNA polymerase sigma-70 factor (ECF subfamily)
VSYQQAQQKQRALRRLKIAVHDLPREFRTPLRMHCLRELPVGRVARRLKVPVGTVLSRIYRGKELLRKSFAKYPPPEVL